MKSPDQSELFRDPMYAASNPMRMYQQQSVTSSSPQQLVVKLYDIGISACHAGDRPRLRAALVELMSSLNFEDGGDIAPRLHALYEYCLNESATGDMNVVCDLLTNLRDAWREVAKPRQPQGMM